MASRHHARRLEDIGRDGPICAVNGRSLGTIQSQDLEFRSHRFPSFRDGFGFDFRMATTTSFTDGGNTVQFRRHRFAKSKHLVFRGRSRRRFASLVR